MNRVSVAVACVSAAVVIGAAPAKKAEPVARYWMDVSTASGMGAGMMGGGSAPNMAQVMAMMNGGGAPMKMLDLRLASRDKPASSAQADHLVPASLMMGPSLPLVTPAVVKQEPAPTGLPANFQQPKGRMLIYWGCGERAGAGQPTVIDFAKVAAGKVPPGMAAMASMARVVSGPTSAPGFGRWPNPRDGRQVPAPASLMGAHKVQANYAPPIAFSLGAGQDFMGALGLREGGNRLMWNAVPNATGYALMMFGANANGDVVMWSSANKAQMPAMDYVAPGEVRRLIAAGAVLPPSTTQCVVPAEVAAAAPQGMVQMIGYGPEADFSDDPKAPKWTVKVRYKTNASLMRGMGEMMQGMDDGGAQAAAPLSGQPQQQPRKKRRLGLGDLIKAIPR